MLKTLEKGGTIVRTPSSTLFYLRFQPGNAVFYPSKKPVLLSGSNPSNNIIIYPKGIKRFPCCTRIIGRFSIAPVKKARAGNQEHY
jgi:hypothetical protein